MRKINRNRFVKIFGLSPWFFVFILVCLDQGLKFFVKSSFYIGEQREIFNWFSLYFVENNGFAFGYEFFGAWGKLLLTTVRIVFVFVLFKWVVKLLKAGLNKFVFLAFLLVFSGAIGNIIDSVFYGVFYGYAPLFFGKVVDMFYFPLFSGTYPGWVPFFGGKDFLFFKYIFNLADSYITCGAVLLLIFYNRVPVK